MIAQVTRRASGSYDGRRCSICRGIKQSLALYFSLTGNDHIDPNEDVAQHASRESITSYSNDEDDGSSSPSGGEEVGEGERDDEEHNSEEETLPLEIFFLPLNQNSLDKRVKLAVGFIPSECPVSSPPPIGIGMSERLREGRRRKRQRSSRLRLRHSALSGRQRRSALLPHFNDYLGHGEG